MKLISTPNVLNEKSKLAEKVFGTEKFNVLNIQLKAGESIPSHFTVYDVIIIVRSGVVTFTVEGETVELTSESILHMDPKENHSLEAKEDVDLLVVQIN